MFQVITVLPVEQGCIWKKASMDGLCVKAAALECFLESKVNRLVKNAAHNQGDISLNLDKWNV